ncbi:MAG: hypothetical protein J6Q31_07550 [Alistipes sp.]|nr:hypothetical protein [Alistipes sp.]
MAEYILQILRRRLMVVFSWGFHRPTALPDNRGLVFKVDGFKYKGMVKVIYNVGADLFEIHLDDGSIEEDVYADQLVDIIDSMVERCDDYDKRILATYTNK